MSFNGSCVGARYYLDFRDSKFGSLGKYQTLQPRTSEVLVRLAKIYLSAGTGNGKDHAPRIALYIYT